MILDGIQVDFDTATYNPMLEEILADKTKKLQNPQFRVCIEAGAIIEDGGSYINSKIALFDRVFNNQEEIDNFVAYLKNYNA